MRSIKASGKVLQRGGRTLNEVPTLRSGAFLTIRKFRRPEHGEESLGLDATSYASLWFTPLSAW